MMGVEKRVNNDGEARLYTWVAPAPIMEGMQPQMLPRVPGAHIAGREPPHGFVSMGDRLLIRELVRGTEWSRRTAKAPFDDPKILQVRCPPVVDWLVV